MNLTEPLRRLGLIAPERPALIAPEGTTFDYAALDHLLDLVGLAAERLGLRPGDAVGLALAGPEQFRELVVALGLARRGIASAVPLAQGLRLLMPPEPMAAPAGGPDVLPIGRFWDGLAAFGDDQPPGPIHADPAALFRLFASSGTTGRPKLMAADHRLMAERVQDQWRALQPISPVHVVAGSMGVPWGMTQALRTLWAGGTLVVSHTAALHEAVLRHGVTSIACAPGILAELLDAMPGDAPPPPSLRQIEVSGSVLSPRLRQRASERLCPNILSYFGSAETGGIASAPFALLEGLPGAVGYLHPGARAEAVDAEHRPLPPGEEGVLRVRSHSVVPGYLGDAETTARCFRDGWFYSGDVGRIDADGLLSLTGRASEVINAGGLKVAPGVIEQALFDWPAIEEAAAFGAPDADGVTRICAAVVCRAPLDAKALAAHLERRLGLQAPRYVMQIASLPRNPTGKLRRDVLAEMATRQMG